MQRQMACCLRYKVRRKAAAAQALTCAKAGSSHVCQKSEAGRLAGGSSPVHVPPPTTPTHPVVPAVLAATAITGVLQAVVGGQPLLIVGVAEPIVITYKFMYEFAKDREGRLGWGGMGPAGGGGSGVGWGGGGVVAGRSVLARAGPPCELGRVV